MFFLSLSVFFFYMHIIHKPGKEEADGKADNYRVRRMFPFRIQKMLGDLGRKDGSETNMLK